MVWLRAAERGAADRAAICLLARADEDDSGRAEAEWTGVVVPAFTFARCCVPVPNCAGSVCCDPGATVRICAAHSRISPHRQLSTAVTKDGIAERVSGSTDSTNSNHWLNVGTVVAPAVSELVAPLTSPSSESSAGKKDCTRPWLGRSDSAANVSAAPSGRGASTIPPLALRERGVRKGEKSGIGAVEGEAAEEEATGL